MLFCGTDRGGSLHIGGIMFKRVQNLHLVFKHKENPLRCFLPWVPIGPGILVGKLGRDVVLEDPLGWHVNSSMDLCFV